jgi:hypothetical protein
MFMKIDPEYSKLNLFVPLSAVSIAPLITGTLSVTYYITDLAFLMTKG